jgi:2-keto-3-deoxy-L-rhamnonate aldolase RhmA
LKNELKWRLHRGEQTVGAWISIPHPDVSEALSTLPFDWFVFDQEHSPLDDQLSQELMQAIKGTRVTPLIRVAWNDPVMIKKALDTGAYGVVVPWVNSRDDAVKAVRACRYPPEGIRGCGPRRPQLFDPDYMSTANREILIIAQIETEEAVERAEEILSVEGVDVFFIGPFDLSTSMGLMGQITHPRVQEAIDKVFKVGKKLDVASGIWCGAGMTVRERLKQGWQFISLGTDLNLLLSGAQMTLEEAGIPIKEV